MTASTLEQTVEALLFLSPEPVGALALADAIGVELDEITAALASLAEHYDTGRRGLVLRELAGGYVLASHPESEDAARRLLAKPRTPPLTAAQAETLSIVAYLQPVSRPEIARIRGVSAESAATTLIERGMIEEAGRSQFGAVLYRTTELFLKLFGLNEVSELPAIEGFDPSAEFVTELRERLLKAGEARAGIGGVTGTGPVPAPDLQTETAETAETGETGETGETVATEHGGGDADGSGPDDSTPDDSTPDDSTPDEPGADVPHAADRAAEPHPTPAA